jgi:hypothetical protein
MSWSGRRARSLHPRVSMPLKVAIGYALIPAIAGALILVWRMIVRRQRRERVSSRINLLD